MSKKKVDETIRQSINRNFKHFKEIFNSELEMYDYFLRFKKIHEDPEDAYYELFSLSDYYRAMKIVKPDFLKLIMLISLIEKLNSKSAFQTFPEWLKKTEIEYEKCNKKKIRKIYATYEEEFGCSSKFRKFFQKYLTKKEKIELLESIRFYIKLDTDSKSSKLVPMFCFKENVCRLAPYYSCPRQNYDRKDCPICENEKTLKKSLDEFAEFLYALRSNFVHNAIIFDLASPKSVTHHNGVTMDMGLATYIQYRFRKIKRPEYKGTIFLELTANHLENILNRNFKKLLNNYITNRIGKSYNKNKPSKKQTE